MRQNERITADNLERIEDDQQLQSLVRSNALVALPDNQYVRVASTLPEDRRYVRSWTRQFLLDFGEKHYSLFNSSVQVNSAVRTVEFQRQLARRNHNAAPDTGDLASPHLSGATIDITKKGMSPREIAWARSYLLELQRRGVLDVEEEFRQSVLHITVYRDFAPAGLERASAKDAAAQVKN